MLHRDDVDQEGFLPVLLVIIEVPAILVAIFLHRQGKSPGHGVGYREIVREVMLNRSVFLLLQAWWSA